ncbi:MAG: DNA polymerase III subunit delta [Spirochaetaceae bacterium]|nr:DNA polymerase III subunit delta [Spirochaetaceae bacterium]
MAATARRRTTGGRRSAASQRPTPPPPPRGLAGGVHLLLGPELGQKSDFVAQIVAAAEAAHGDTEVLRTFPYDTDLIDLVAALRTPGLFTSHRVVVLQEVQDLRAGNQLDALLGYGAEPSAASTLVLTSAGMARDLPAALPRMVPRARTRIFWEMFENRRESAVQRAFRTRGVRIDAEACALILELAPTDSAALEALCGSLAGFFPSGAFVAVEDIEQYLYHSREETVFSLFDRVVARDLQGCLETLTTLLLARRGDAVQIVAMLHSQFQRLIRFKELLAARTAPAAALAELRITGKRMQRTFQEAHRRYADAEMEPIQRLLVEFDTRARLFSQELTEPLLQLLLYHIVARGGQGVWRPFRV